VQIAGKVVLITGASEGIGAACAAEFARAGARLSLTARSESGLQAAGGPGALITAGDLLDPATRQHVVERTAAELGGIDVLINNAGIGDYTPSWRIPMDQAHRLMELNFFAALEMIQLTVPHMRRRGGGMIVNIGSIGGKIPLPWATIYTASKYALGALTEGLRVELWRDRIRTMIVCPGYVKTGFQKHSPGEAPASLVAKRKYAISAETCAAAVRRGVERDARTVVTPASGWMLVAAVRLFPGLVESRMARWNGTA
jgi:short-subunit dehydrogenase